MITKFMMRMFAELPEPDGLVCMVGWFLLLALFSKDAVE